MHKTASGKSNAREAYQNSDHKHKIDLRILCQLHRLRHLELLILHAGLVLADPLQHPNDLPLLEKVCAHRGVGEAEECPNADEYGHEPKDDEHDSPAFERGVLDVLKAVRDYAADDLAEPESAVPEPEACRLFLLGVPHACIFVSVLPVFLSRAQCRWEGLTSDNGKTRRNCSLEYA